MKKLFTLLMCLVAITASAQDKGRFETYDLNNFKLHVYYSNDVMGDASYIIEGKKGLVTMEEPLFKVGVKEFNTYLEKLNKPVVKRITDYHVGGTGDNAIVMAEGMPAFVSGPVYGGMMNGFAKNFGDAMVSLPTGEASEVQFGSTEKWAGVPFTFNHGATSDFPAASILIGKQVYYTHWTPAKSHPSALQISSREAVDAELAEAQKELASGATIFIGGHCGAAKRDAVEFKIAYLTKMKQLLGENNSADEFVESMKKAYPGLTGESGLVDLAKALYK